MRAPLDPNHPPKRWDDLLRDLEAPLIVTERSFLDRLPESDLPRVCLDRDGEALLRLGRANLSSRVDPDNLAYIIYTSGSTGKPKGVEVTHRAVSNLIAWHRHAFELTRADHTTQLARPGFDASVWEVWPSLATGASVCFPPDEIIATPGRLLEWLATEGITVAFLPTPLAEAVLRERWQPRLALRCLLTGGDRLRRTPSPDFAARVVNNYGPTEGTVVTTSTDVACEETNERFPAIGRPIDNVQVYLLDRHLNPVTIGVEGELHIGGAGLARGYLHRSDLTAQSFIANPFSEQPGDRLYKTGDRARFLPDGSLDFLGRTDHQIKIRAHRIEPAEVEFALCRHPNVKEALVVAKNDSRSSVQLVAYVVTRGGKAGSSSSDLRQFLREGLPDFMVPPWIVAVDRIPRSSNGKPDLKRLPALDTAAQGTDQTRIAPRNAIEELLAHFWSDTLGLEQIGVEDNFFDLGGHSLLASQITLRIHQALAVELPLRTFFAQPTISAQAATILEQPSSRHRVAKIESLLARVRALTDEEGLASSDKNEIPRRALDMPIRPSFAQERLWLVEKMVPGTAAYNVPIALRLDGNLNLAALKNALEEILRRHEGLRITVVEEDGEPFLRIGAPTSFSLPILDLRHLPALHRKDRASARIAEQARRPFSLSDPVLFRSELIDLGEREHVLFLNFHHIIFDGWSVGVFCEELRALYESFSNGQPSPLVDLAIQYTDFAAWQRGFLGIDTLEREIRYWKDHLAGCPRTPILEPDHARGDVPSFDGATQSVRVSQTTTSSLHRLGREMDTTVFSVLLAAFNALLSLTSGREDLLVATPVAGRTQAGTESLIGFFVNTLLLRADLSGNPSFRELVGRVKETVLEAHAHQDLPFEKLVEQLRPERDPGRTPFVQVAFALQNDPLPMMTQSNLLMTASEVETETAKTDLALFIRETGDGLIASLEYRTDLFESDTISRLLENFHNILRRVAQDPDLPLDQLRQSEDSNLTRNQLLIWTGQMLQPDVPLYNMVLLFEIHGPVRTAPFRNAFATLLRSSDALRSIIVESAHGLPRREVLSPQTIDRLLSSLSSIDLSHQPHPHQEARDWVRKRALRTFQPGQPLFDSALIKLSDPVVSGVL